MDSLSRPAWFLVGTLALFVLLLCSVVVIGTFYVTRQLEAQQQQINTLRATLNAPVQPTSAVALATTTPTPQALASALPTALVTVLPSRSASTSTLAPTTPANTTAATRSVPTPNQRPVSDLAQALVVEKRAALADHPRAPLYRIGARLDAEQRTIVGNESIQMSNDVNANVTDLCIRLYANASFYSGGTAAQIGDVRLNGQTASVRMEQQNTLLRITLPTPLANGQAAQLSLNFTTTVPTNGGGYGIFTFSNGVFALHYWHPELTAYNPDGSCVVHAIGEQGDLHNTFSSNYLLTFAAPQSYTLITSGVEVNQSSANDETIHEIVSPLTRNFVMVASDRFQQMSQSVGATKVNSYYLSADEKGGKAALAASAKALDVFSKKFSPYPYSEFDVVEVSLSGGAAGVESTGLIFLARDVYDSAKTNPFGDFGPLMGSTQTNLDVLGFVAAHETAHEWWYGMVGNDAFQQPWLDESLANWSAAYFVDQTAGAESGLMARDLFVRLPYLLILLDHDE